MKIWRWTLGVRRLAFPSDHQREHEHEHEHEREEEQPSIENGLAISVQVDC